MEKTRFYPAIWAVSPSGSNVVGDWYANDREVKELILKNSAAKELGVSEMELNITAFAAIDKSGEEHHILDFPGQNSVNIKGMGSGFFLRSKSMVNLKPGTYKAIRFYIEKRNSKFIYSDGTSGKKNNSDFIDFKMEKSLKLKKGDKTEIKLWFDLAPYQFSRHYKPLTDWFKSKIEQLPRLISHQG